MSAALDLQSSVQFLKGVGPRSAAKFAKLHVHTLSDLLFTLPTRYIDRRTIDSTGAVSSGSDRVVVGEVVSSAVTQFGRRRAFRAIIDDSSGPIEAVWFHFSPKRMAQQVKAGQCVMLSGTVSQYGRKRQFVHPEVEAMQSGEVPASAARVIPVYPSTEGLTQRSLRQAMSRAWQAVGDCLTEIVPADLRKSHALLTMQSALQAVHFPDNDCDIEALNQWCSPAQRSLIFGEAFVLELGLALRRAQAKQQRAEPLPWCATVAQEFSETLPFTMTAAQTRVLSEVAEDLAMATPMHRLVQGDVGSGKTAVATACALQAIRAGRQVALMAPTEILAEQHAASIRPWMSQLGVPMAHMTGSTSREERALMLDQLMSGELPFVIGTHALLEDDVQFAHLGLVLIDEQHRFGVAQRMTLRSKGVQPHVLVLTATPIPRSLAMSHYGDIDISIIDELPPGRKPVMTKHYTEPQRTRMYAGMRREIQRGRQVYVVCPLVEESEHIAARDATQTWQDLCAAMGEDVNVALLHGRMSADEKATVMQAFSAGDVQVLVSTTVIEVGVDVPNATVMIIEQAERFGLAQLHQLRGRVGRGQEQSYCVLMTPARLSEDAAQRIDTMVASTDGFHIAEVDLAMRGPGEFLGTKQSGIPDLQLVDLLRDGPILEEARQAAFACIADDPELRNQPQLLHAVLQRWAHKLELGSVG